MSIARVRGNSASTYCGTQHALMLLRVYVQTRDEFDHWIREQSQPAQASGAISEGQKIFERTACINCHAVGGTAANGRFGPDLTHLMSRDTIASGAAQNTSANLRRWIQDPNTIKPGSTMPAMGLSDPELEVRAVSSRKCFRRQRRVGKPPH